MELPRESLMTWAVAFTGRYDASAVEQVTEYVAPGTTALDIGASLGLWTVQLGRIAAMRGASLWAFEPNPANTTWIRRNVELNDLSSTVTVCETGLGDKAESSILVGAEYGVGNGAIALESRESTEKHPRIPVTLARLDEIDLPSPVSFMKIDVEGYEAAVLRGAASLIARDRPVIYGEFAGGWLERREESLSAMLADLNYDAMTLSPLRAGRVWSSRRVEPAQPVDPAVSGALPQNLLLCPRSPSGVRT